MLTDWCLVNILQGSAACSMLSESWKATAKAAEDIVICITKNEHACLYVQLNYKWPCMAIYSLP